MFILRLPSPWQLPSAASRSTALDCTCVWPNPASGDGRGCPRGGRRAATDARCGDGRASGDAQEQRDRRGQRRQRAAGGREGGSRRHAAPRHGAEGTAEVSPGAWQRTERGAGGGAGSAGGRLAGWARPGRSPPPARSSRGRPGGPSASPRSRPAASPGREGLLERSGRRAAPGHLPSRPARAPPGRPPHAHAQGAAGPGRARFLCVSLTRRGRGSAEQAAAVPPRAVPLGRPGARNPPGRRPVTALRRRPGAARRCCRAAGGPDAAGPGPSRPVGGGHVYR